MRSSFVRAALSALKAEMAPLGGGLTASRIPGESPAAPVVLRDLSPLPRTGFKGADTPKWLATQGVSFSDAHNRAYAQPDGSLLARLSPGEFLLLGCRDGATGLVDTLDGAWSWEADLGLCFPVPRQDSHAWFHLSGPACPAMFAKICAIDLRPHKFTDGAIAQTSIARLNGIVIRQGDAFHLLSDSASAEYMWGCLVDAMDEFGGSVAGIASL